MKLVGGWMSGPARVDLQQSDLRLLVAALTRALEGRNGHHHATELRNNLARLIDPDTETDQII